MTTALTANLDAELPVVKAILKRDRAAFEEFVRRQSKWVRGVIFGVLGDSERIDDVAQQVWTTVWQQMDTMRDPQRWRTWLYRLARNAAVDAGRETTRRRKLNKALEERTEVNGKKSAVDQSAADLERRVLVADAVRALPGLYREPFVLRHLEGWSYRQIADVLSMPVDTVETRLVRARRQLREMLKNVV